MNDKVCAFCINFDNVDENAIKCVKNCDNSKIQNCASGKQSCLHFLFAVSPAISSDVLETLLKNENFNNDFSAYTLSPINLVNPNVTVIDKEDK